MRMRDPAIGIGAMVAVLAGCAPASGPGAGSGLAASGPVTVRSAGAPFTFADGAAARALADAECGPRGVRTSIYDRFDAAAGAWVFAEGCA